MSDRKFVVYDAGTGEILRFGSCSTVDLIAQGLAEGEAVMEGVGGDETHYVTGLGTYAPDIVAKTSPGVTQDKATIAADEIEEIAFTGIPIDAAAVIVEPDLTEVVADHDGSIEYTTGVPGAYRLRISGVPYLTETLTFEAR